MSLACQHFLLSILCFDLKPLFQGSHMKLWAVLSHLVYRYLNNSQNQYMTLSGITPVLFFAWGFFVCFIKKKVNGTSLCFRGSNANLLQNIAGNPLLHLSIHVSIIHSFFLATLWKLHRPVYSAGLHSLTHSCIAAEQGHAKKCCAVCPNCDSNRANKSWIDLTHTHALTHK